MRRVISRSDIETKGDAKKIAIQHYDQLGRVRLTRQIENVATEDPTNEQHGIKVQTRYLTGNPHSYQLSSNPYRANYSSNAATEESMGWTRSKSINTGKHSEVETFTGASLPAPWGSNTNSTGIVTTDIDAERTLVTDQTGKQRISKTNALGQLVNVWEVKDSDADTEAVTFGALSLNALKTSYQYDTLNNLTTVLQGGQTRSFSYSSLSRLLTAANPESGLINYNYDKNGNLTTKTDARNVVTTYIYDALNRVTNRNYSAPANLPNYQATPNVTYTYDNLPNAKGKLIKVVTGNVNAPFAETRYTAFDNLGRVTGSQQVTEGTAYNPQTYIYNLSGALIEETYPSGRVVKNTLDNDGDLQQVQSRKANDTFRNYANSFNYTAAGAVSSLRLGNGRWENTTFNSRLQPIQIGLGSSATSQNLLKLNFNYGGSDNNGNVKSQQIVVPTIGANTGFTAIQTYTYDSLNRIKDAKEMIGTTQEWKQTFTYDRYGNRNFDTANNNTTTIPSGCAVAVCNPQIDPATNKLIGYQFDNSGNTKVDANGQTFIYDAENKQVQVNNSNGIVGQYFYDGDGKRIKKIVPSTGEITIFVYDASGKMVAEYSTAIASPQDAKVSYLTSDHLGSPRINTDANGQVIARHDYQPFGEEITRASYGADSVRQKFTSYEHDIESELDFAQARYFSYGHGRFTSVDPYNIIFEKDAGRDAAEKLRILIGFISQPQLWNRYAYVANNPLKYIDPSGEILELTGDENDRNQAFNRIKKMVGEKSAAKLKVVERDGRYFVEYNGTNNSLAATGNMGVIIADIIDSSVTTEYRIVYGNSATDANGVSRSFSDSGGAMTVPVSENRTQIFVSYNALNIVNGIKHRDENGKLLENTPETVDAHEFGHAWGIQKDNVYSQIKNVRGGWVEWASSIGSSRGTKEEVIVQGNNSQSVMVENFVRDRLKLARKRSHQP